MKLAETFGNFAFAIAARVMGLRDIGPAIAPMNAFLILTGSETLPLRMARHCENALAVATWLEKHPKVAWVGYAGLPSSKYHAIQKRLYPKGAGAVFTFGLKGGYEAGVQLVSGLKLFSHLANIGDTRSPRHPSGVDDAPAVDRRAAHGGGRRAGRRAPVGRHRGQGRHHRRPGAGAGAGVTDAALLNLLG